MKLAHLILTHSNPARLERLVRRLQHQNADVYIHIDKKIDSQPFHYLEKLGGVYLIQNRIAVDWGNYNMIGATLSSFKEILASNIEYSHINLLSAQDYPLKSPEEIQQFLFANAGRSFMNYRLIPDEWDEPLTRLTQYNFGDFKIPGKYQLQNMANKFLPARKIPAGMKIYGRSQWLTITPEAIRYTFDFLGNNKKAARFLKLTWAVDELFFQTILLNSPLKDTIVNDHLRYIKFKKGAPNPETLTINDAQELIESGKFYARKFDGTVDGEILDFLDAQMLAAGKANAR